MSYVEHPLVKQQSLERREYQIEIASKCSAVNSMVVLPTGLGKTAVSLLVIANQLQKYPKKRCVILAPTRVLVHQHYEFLLKNLNVDSNNIAVITGQDPNWEREEKWAKKVVCATPQIMRGDVKRGLVNLESVSLIVFDEAHRAVGDYAYCDIAEEFTNTNPDARVIGMTASLPSDRNKVFVILRTLRIQNIEFRDHESVDVKSYVQETKIDWIEVELSEPIKQILGLLRKGLGTYVDQLKQGGLNVKFFDKVSLKTLLEARREIETHGRYELRSPLYTAIRLVHAIDLVETQGISAFIKFFERLSLRERVIGLKKLMNNEFIKEAYEIAKGARLIGEEHLKIRKLKEVLEPLQENEKAIVFTGYRDSVEELFQRLSESGLRVGYLIGKSGDSGQSQYEQVQALDDLKKGKFNILIATQVGEEGLDVAECNLVVFYDNVSSAVRFVQRRGRTGRKAPGRVVAFMTKGTKDEAYFWIVKKRMREAKKTVAQVNHIFKKSLDGYFTNSTIEALK
ncbi:MAG: DEAD/DEAH box helicase [Thaumarchaeota archaeon]|nr:DEAD/DEAH box helicase [Nitrososphaerota archaeon]